MSRSSLFTDVICTLGIARFCNHHRLSTFKDSWRVPRYQASTQPPRFSESNVTIQ